MKKKSSVDQALGRVASFPFRVLCWVIDMFLLAALFGFVILFILQFIHSPKLLHFSAVAALKRVGNPVLAEISSWVGMDWPAKLDFSFIPIVMAFLTWLVKIVVDGIFLKGGGLFARIGKTFEPPTHRRVRSS